MSSPELNVKLSVELGNFDNAAKAAKERLDELTKSALAADEAVRNVGKGSGSASTPGLDAARAAMESTVSEMRKQMDLLQRENAKLKGTLDTTASELSRVRDSVAQLGTAHRASAASTNTATAAARKLREEQKHLNTIMHEGHSAARGLAQGFGAMVFTYGSIVPLLAGAAISNTIVNTVKDGMALERHLTFVSQLTDGATISVGMFEQAMKGSQIAVRDGAEGLRALAQSGFDSQQALIALPEVLKLATVGELSVGQAALTATGIMHAFNLELGDLPHIVDVLTKSAAESNTSVASMMESLKTASVGADQFGVSLEEMSGALEILGKRNITGTAAGTALKNMMTELSSPTEKAAARMAQLGFSAYDATGKLKPFETQLEELRNKMINLDEQSRNTVLTDLFNERGRRGAAALLKDFDDLQVRIERLRTGADGFASTVNQALGVTVSGQVKTLANDFQVILGSAFEKTSDAWSNLVAELADFVKSTGFRDAITAVSTGVIFLAENIGTLTATLAAGAMGFRLYALGMAGVTAASVLLVGGTEAAAAATTALSTALSRVFWPVAIVGVLATAYFTLRSGVDEAAEAHKRLLREGEDLIASQAKSIRDTLESGRAFEEAARSGRKYADVLAEIRNGTKNAELSDASEKKFETARAEYLKLKALMGEAENGVATAAVRVAEQRMIQAANEMSKVRNVIAEGDATTAALKTHTDATNLAREKESLANGTKALILEVASRRGIVEGYADKSQAVYEKLADVWNRAREIDPSDVAGVARLKVEFSDAQKAVQALSTSVGSLKDDKSGPSTKVLDHTKELTAQINLLKLEQANADREFANVDSMNKRNQALRGYATEAETAATYMQALSKIESQYTIDAINAEKAVVSAEDSLKKLRGASKPDAAAIAEAEKMLESAWGTYEATLGELDAKTDITKVTAGLVAGDSSRAAWSKVIAENAAREKTARERVEAVYQSGLSVSRARNALEMIGKNLTVAQTAELTEQDEVRQAIHEKELAFQVALVEYETRLAEIRVSGSSDPVLKWQKQMQAEQDMQDARVAASAAADAKIELASIKRITAERTEYQKTFDSIERGLVDALMKGGHEGAQAVRELLVDALVSEPFEIVVRTLLQPVTQGLTNAAVSSVGGSAAGSAGGSLLGNAVGSLAGAQAGAALSSGSGLIGQFASGFSGSASTAASLMGAEMTTAASLGSMVAAALPWVAGAMLIASLAGGETRSGAQYSNSGITGAVNYTEGPSGGEISSEAARAAFTGAQGSINLMLKRVGSSATLAGFNAGLESSENGKGFAGAGGTLSTGASFGDTGDLHNVNRGSKTAEEAMAEYTMELRKSVLQALQAATDVPQDLHDKLAGIDFNAISDASFTAIEKTVYSVIGLQEALVNLPFDHLEKLSYSAAEGLLTAADALDTVADNSLESLNALLSGYYDGFYSDSEKAAQLTTNTTAAFAKLNLALPAVSTGLGDWYRNAVEAAMAMDQSNPAVAQTTAGLLALSGSVTALGSAAESVQKLIDGIHTSVEDSIWQMQYGMGTDAEKYAMWDVKAKGLDDQLYAATSIEEIARIAAEEIKAINSSWSLLDPTQQKSTYGQYEQRLETIDAFVTTAGADPASIKKADNEAFAKTVSDAVAIAVEKAMEKSAKAQQNAADAQAAAAANPTPIEVKVTVDTSASVEVDISSRGV